MCCIERGRVAVLEGNRGRGGGAGVGNGGGILCGGSGDCCFPGGRGVGFGGGGGVSVVSPNVFGRDNSGLLVEREGCNVILRIEGGLLSVGGFSCLLFF